MCLDVEPHIDEPSIFDANPANSFVEAGFLVHKTAARAKSKLRLPVVGLARGVTGLPWARAWLDARARLGRSADVDHFLTGVDAFGDDGIVLQRAATTEVSK